ncbi:MAG: translation initiation factor [Candidatus Woesearchaeota archaeon]|nr:translation initiation factor [Candidatus Woesearchaeota archaeon]
MSGICPTCGLPKELCVCETIAKEDQIIKVKLAKRKFGKLTTLIEGIDPRKIDIKDVAKKLKSKFACGGTVKGNSIELQGDHKSRVKEELIKLGFASNTIDTN